jgi:hypothetical protein
MIAWFALIPLLAAALLAASVPAPVVAAEGKAGDGTADIAGLRGIRWGMTVDEAIALFGDSFEVQKTKTTISGCNVRHAIPIRLLDEEWAIWLCETPEEAVIAALNIESRSGRTRHFDLFLEAFTEAYGPAHRYWHTCHNVNWNKTVQYDWYFPDMRVSLVDRDQPAQWVAMRYEAPSPRLEFGPGVCVEPPLDLRRDAAPE